MVRDSSVNECDFELGPSWPFPNYKPSHALFLFLISLLTACCWSELTVGYSSEINESDADDYGCPDTKNEKKCVLNWVVSGLRSRTGRDLNMWAVKVVCCCGECLSRCHSKHRQHERTDVGLFLFTQPFVVLRVWRAPSICSEPTRTSAGGALTVCGVLKEIKNGGYQRNERVLSGFEWGLTHKAIKTCGNADFPAAEEIRKCTFFF